MLTRLLSLILFSVFATPALAYPINAGERTERFEIQSEILGETREFVVLLPDSYETDPDRRYPVLYLTDAVWQFDLIAATMDYHAHWGRIPEHIIVGAFNEVRNLDLVPAVDPRYPFTGGGDAYLDHFTQELLPEIDQRFRTNDVQLLFGHSFGGVMVLNQLLTDPEAFDAYIALGSSTWVSDRVLFDRLEEASGRDFTGRVLYTSVGETDGGATVPDGELFAERLRTSPLGGLEWTFEITPGENHFTNVPEGLHRAIAFIYPFAHQQAELIAAGEAGGPEAVRNWFAESEESLDWRFVPQSMELGLAGFMLANSSHLDAANAVFAELEARFPDNVEVVAVRANALGVAGQLEDAMMTIDRAIAMGEAHDHPASRVQAFREFRNRLIERAAQTD